MLLLVESIGNKNTHKHVVSTPKNVTLLKIRFGFSSSMEKNTQHKIVCCSWEGGKREKENRCVSGKYKRK